MKTFPRQQTDTLGPPAGGLGFALEAALSDAIIEAMKKALRDPEVVAELVHAIASATRDPPSRHATGRARDTYTVQEVLSRTGISRTTFYKAVSRGDLVIKKLGRRTLVSAASLDQWLTTLGQR